MILAQPATALLQLLFLQSQIVALGVCQGLCTGFMQSISQISHRILSRSLGGANK